MYTFLFQFFLTIATVGLVVVAIRTYRADRVEAKQRRNDARELAIMFINERITSGYYYGAPSSVIEEDFDLKYNQLINQ